MGCLLFVVCGSRLLVVCWPLLVAMCLLFVVCCLLTLFVVVGFVVSCWLCLDVVVRCRPLFAVRWWLFCVVCVLLFDDVRWLCGVVVFVFVVCCL